MKIKKTIILTATIVIFGLPMTTVGAFWLAYFGKIYPKTAVAEIDISGLTSKQAINYLSKKLNERKLEKIDLVFENQQWPITLSEISFSYNLGKTIENAYRQSRKGVVKNWLAKNGKNLPLQFDYDPQLLKEKVASISAFLNQPAIPTEIVLDPKTKEIFITEGKQGQEIDFDALQKQIDEKFAFLKDNSIELVFKKTNGLPSEAQKQSAKKRAENLLGKTITLTSKQQNFVISDEQLVKFVGFFENWNREKIKEYFEILSQSLEKEPQNALFQFENGRVIAFQPDSFGYHLDKDSSEKILLEALEEVNKGEKNSFKELPVKEISPEVKISDTNRLGISELIGEGESFFFHSIPSRIHNINLASSKLHGVLIAPGEIFSVNKILGEISKATGYQDAYIIQNGRTILGAGGGVCQVSTTLFRAALNTGLPIIERHPHAYRVSYYEYNAKPGFDAGVFYPSADLKFANDTPSYILIQRVFDEKNRRLVFQFYGQSDNRKVEISNIRVWDIIPPPEDLYIDDPSLPAGTIKQIDFKAWGAKAAFDWKVTKNNEILHQQTFYSPYRPWRAIYLKGTKTN